MRSDLPAKHGIKTLKFPSNPLPLIHVRWARHHWPVILTLLLGIITATGLAATGPVLVNQVLTFAFRRNLLNAPVSDGNLRLSIREQVDEVEFAHLDNQIQRLAASSLAAIPHEIFPSGTLPTLIPWQEGQLNTSQRINVRFYGDDLRERVTVVSGDWPPAESVEGDGAAVVIGRPLAEAYELGIGDRLMVSKQASGLGADLWLEVAAIVQPLDGQDPFWFGEFSPLRVRFDGRFRQYNAIVSRETFFSFWETHFPEQSPGFDWPVLIDANRLTLNDIPELEERLDNLPDQLWQIDPQLRLATGLPVTVGRFAEQADEVRTPLTFLTATTALLAFFFVAMAAALAAIRMEGEWDLMHSRGTPTYRLLAQQFVRVLLLTLVAILIGAIMAGLTLRGLAIAGPLADISDPSWKADWPAATWTAVFIAAIACAVVLLWPFAGLSRRPAASRLQTIYRPEKASWWQRYYVDVLIVALGLILLGRFVGGGGLIAGREAGRGTDWLLVLAPVATMLGGLAILLRLFPPVINAVSHLVGRLPQSVPFLALAYSARSHQRATRLVLLFTLTVALGIFASSVDDALTHNEIARARYAAGGEVRLVGTDTKVVAPGDQVSSGAWRGKGTFHSPIDRSYPTYDVLAIEPESFLRIAELRPDFAREPVDSLVGELRSPDVAAGVSLPIPSSGKRLGLWLFMPTAEPDAWEGVDVDVKVADSDGNVSLLAMALERSSEIRWRQFTADLLSPPPVLVKSIDSLAEGEWQQFTVDLPSPPPTQLKSIWLRSLTYSPELGEFLAYDDVTVTDGSGRESVLEDFESIRQAGQRERFWGRTDPESTYPYYYASGVEPHSGKIKLEFSFGRSGIRPGEWYGLVPIDLDSFEVPVFPVLVSSGFAQLTASDVNDRMSLRLQQSNVRSMAVLIRVVGIVDYFPTLYDESEAGYLVTLRDPLLALFNNTLHDAMQTNEHFLDHTPTPAIANQAAQVIDRVDVQRTLRAFPLAVGLRTASLLGYILATLITLGSFAAHLVFTVSQRRGQFAVLRAIGMETGQLFGLLLVEQMVLVFSGLVLGTIAGVILTWLTLGNLNFDWGGLAAAPPFVAVWDWGATMRTYGLFAITVLLALAMAVLIIRRIGLQRALSIAID